MNNWKEEQRREGMEVAKEFKRFLSEEHISGKKMQDKISRMVNGSSNPEKEGFAEELANSPENVREIINNVFFSYFLGLGENFQKGVYDLRNEASCKAADKIISALNLDVVEVGVENDESVEHNEFVECALYDHRTLQQLFTGLIMAYFNKLEENGDELGKQVLDASRGIYLPLI